MALLCGVTLSGLPQAQAQDDPPGRVGRLAVLQGEAWVYEPEQDEWVAALLNRPITSGDRIATAEGASLELQVGSTTLLLGSQTEFEVLRLDDERLQFRLQRGRLALLLRSPEVAAELELLHPEARFQPLRSGLYRIDRLGEASDAVVHRGELKVEGHNLSMTLHAGQRAAFWRDGALGDTTRQWLTQQQDDFAVAMQRLEQATRSAATPQLPAEMTGIEDLDRHGQWQQHPQFGAVWSPSVVAVGWAPFRHGRWVWLRPWGWTWVDAAPWGFAPSHYGRWLWWGNRWFWTPGPRVGRPVFSPGVVGWVGPPPHGAVPGWRPLPGGAWAPLGPHDPYKPTYRVSPGHQQRLNPPLPPGLAQPPGPGAVTPWSGPFFGPARPPREFVAPRPALPVAAVPAVPAAGLPPPAAVPPTRRPIPAVPPAATPATAMPPVPGPAAAVPTRPMFPAAVLPVPLPAAVPAAPMPAAAVPTAPAPTAAMPAPPRPPLPPLTAAPPRSQAVPVAPAAQTAPQAQAVQPAPVATVVPTPRPAPPVQPIQPTQRTQPVQPVQPTQQAQPAQPPERGNAVRAPFGGDTGERRRTPESRYTPRER